MNKQRIAVIRLHKTLSPKRETTTEVPQPRKTEKTTLKMRKEKHQWHKVPIDEPTEPRVGAVYESPEPEFRDYPNMLLP